MNRHLIIFSAVALISGCRKPDLHPLSGIVRGFETIRTDMSLGEYVRARPDAKWRNGDGAGPDTLSTGEHRFAEKLVDGPVFTDALCAFDRGSFRSCLFTWHDSGVVFASKIKPLIKMLEAKFGPFPRKYVEEYREDGPKRKYDAPMLVWERRGYSIYFTYTPEKKQFPDSIGSITLGLVTRHINPFGKSRSPKKSDMALFEWE